MTNLVVFGAGGHAKVVIDVLRASGHCVVAIFDDNPASYQQIFHGCRVEGASSDLRSFAQKNDISHFFVAIGNNAVRWKLAQQWTKQGLKALTAIHPSAIIADSVQIGAGTVVMAGVCINVDAIIGDQVIINTRASIDHDCRIASAVHIAPAVALCGGVSVGERTLIGVGASVIPCIEIGRDVVIGAGAAVICSILNEQTAVGVPARCFSR